MKGHRLVTIHRVTLKYAQTNANFGAIVLNAGKCFAKLFVVVLRTDSTKNYIVDVSGSPVAWKEHDMACMIKIYFLLLYCCASKK